MNWFHKTRTPPPCARSGTKKDFGSKGEETAAVYLLNRGYRIIERNFRCKGGELDIVAFDPGDKCVVFVEVKTRSNLAFGVPQLAVTPFKQRQISKAALTWLAKHRGHDRNARFDVIAIVQKNPNEPVVEHLINAFELAY